MFVSSKNKRKKNIIPADGGHFLRKQIDSRDFKKENLTPKIRRNKEQKPYFLKKIFKKIFKSTKPSNKISP